MDLYKKKSKKFMGKAAEVRAAEMNAARSSLRYERLSLNRSLPEIDAVKSQALPTLGACKSTRRKENLIIWKAEKELKRKMELKAKKPVFVISRVRHPLGALGLQENHKVMIRQKDSNQRNDLLQKQVIHKLEDIYAEKELDLDAQHQVQRDQCEMLTRKLDRVEKELLAQKEQITNFEREKRDMEKKNEDLQHENKVLNKKLDLLKNGLKELEAIGTKNMEVTQEYFAEKSVEYYKQMNEKLNQAISDQLKFKSEQEEKKKIGATRRPALLKLP